MNKNINYHDLIFKKLKFKKKLRKLALKYF